MLNKMFPAFVLCFTLLLCRIVSVESMCADGWTYNSAAQLCTHPYPPDGDCTSLNPLAKGDDILGMCVLTPPDDTDSGLGNGGLPLWP